MGISCAGDLDVAKGRMHKYLRESAATKYQDQELTTLDSVHYHQYKVTFESSAIGKSGFKDYNITLPDGDAFTVFVASSKKYELMDNSYAQEQDFPNRYLGGCVGNSIRIVLQDKKTKRITLRISFGDIQSEEAGKEGYLLVYVFSK
jgi:hypothetical protein